MKLKSFVGIFCVVLMAGSAFAQMPSGQWYVIHTEVVKPSMVKQYEATSKEFVEMVKANQASLPDFRFFGSQSDDFAYTYVVPIENMAGMDAINKQFMSMMTGPSAAQFMDLMKRNGPTIEYVKEWVVGHEPELSYTPETPRLKPEEMKYFHLDVYYIQADKDMESRALSKEFAELFKKKNIPDGYQIFIPVMAAEMPAIIVRVGAKDASDFYASSMKNREMLGEEGKALFERASAITRRFETRNTWTRPDLSVPPPMNEGK